MGNIASQAIQLVIESAEDIRAHYVFEKGILGEGAFGVVRKGKLKATGAVRAVKAISKKKMNQHQAMVKLEVEIMKLLDHPNLLMLYEVLEDYKYLYMVLEMCQGGSLQEHIVKAPLSETTVATLMRQIFRGVLYLHSHCILHRDLKAANCLLDRSEELLRAQVKVADFGLSCHLESGKLLVRAAGTPTHMAPEVFGQRYSFPADIWSCGVICFNCNGQQLPFAGSSREDLANNVTSKPLEFSGEQWMHVSQTGVDFVVHLLMKSVKKRPSARDALQDRWFVENVPETKKATVPYKVLDDLRRFRSRNRFARAALHVIATMLPDEDIVNMRNAFLQLDRDGDGFFTVQELQESWKRHEFETGAGEIESLNNCAFDLGSGDGDQAGLTYTEFLAATFDMKKALKTRIVQAAFASFDKNKDGAISISELATGKMLGELSVEEVVETMEALDIDGNCELDYTEFAKMLRADGPYISETPPRTPRAAEVGT